MTGLRDTITLVGTAAVTAGIAAAEAYVVVKAFEESATMGIATVAGLAATNVIAGGAVKMVAANLYERQIIDQASAMTAAML